MRVTLTDSADEFAAHAGALLAARIEHNVLATVLASVRFRPSGTPMFSYIEDGAGVVVAAALRTPPRRMLASTMNAVIAEALMDAWLERDSEVPGVVGPFEVARSLARAWEQRTGGQSTLAMSEALHVLGELRDPARPANGRLRVAGKEDRELLVAWMRDFELEAGLVDGDDREARVGRGIDRGLLHIWDDDGPVALVGRAPAVSGVVRIGPVYTPPALRARGYASSAVAALTRAMLDGDARQCMLYTDLANPTSNRIYAALGFRRVADWEDLAFAPRMEEASKSPPS
ncbi:MAG: GNAT family N-acetyltransferase [Actinomycetota bacterium]|nr:GNAT family N-acetyltransferase [Actinomycetota bacterium]